VCVSVRNSAVCSFSGGVVGLVKGHAGVAGVD
jgi:hypothetical protein